MAVLYRKYRPQTFAEVVGQKPITETLQSQIVRGSVAHAYLFTGGRGVGKTSFARIMAKALNCQNRTKTGDACGICAACKQVEQGNFMDLVEIDAASNTGVDNIRDLIEHVKFSPSAGTYKVFIIDEVHMLSKGAFNALLKTLEEPPSHAIFILATTEIQKVPATIISRTQRFDFKSYSITDIVGHLQYVVKEEKLKLGTDVLEIIAHQAQGGMRDALSLLDKVLTLGNNPSLEDSRQLLGVTERSLSVQLFQYIAQGDPSVVPGFFDMLLERGIDPTIFNKDFLEVLREVLVVKVTTNHFDPDVAEFASLLSVSDLIFLVRLFLKALKELPDSPNPQIPLLLASIEGASKRLAPVTPIVVGPSKAPSINVQHVPKPAIVPDFTPSPEPLPPVASQTVPDVSDVEVDKAVRLEDILPHWPQVVAQVKQYNSPLGNLLRTSVLLKVENGRVILGVQYLFHKQNLENQKNLDAICTIIESVSGKKIGLFAQVIKTEKPILDLDGSLQDALQVFGGELVE